MDDSKWERYSALGGVAFAVLIAVAGFLPGSPPKTTDSAAKIARFFTDHGDAIRWSAYLGGLGTITALWWSGAVWRLLRRAEGGIPRLAVVALGGIVFAAVMATLGGVIAAVVVQDRVFGSQTTKFFYVAFNNITAATGFGIAAFLTAFAAVIIRSGVLPRVLGWLGGIDALAFVVGSAAVASNRDVFFVVSFVAFIGFLLWVLVVSVLMYRALTRPPTPAVATMAASAAA